jgi:hypothetical protein
VLACSTFPYVDYLISCEERSLVFAGLTYLIKPHRLVIRFPESSHHDVSGLLFR